MFLAIAQFSKDSPVHRMPRHARRPSRQLLCFPRWAGLCYKPRFVPSYSADGRPLGKQQCETLGPHPIAPECASNYCPGCSTRLAPQSCKLICAVCGYYMSCSDFY